MAPPVNPIHRACIRGPAQRVPTQAVQAGSGDASTADELSERGMTGSRCCAQATRRLRAA